MLSSDLAHRLAGKLVFLTSTLFGQLGKAALQPLYARAHGLSEGDHSGQLNFALSPIDIAGPAASDQTTGDPTTTESASCCDLLRRLLRHRWPDTLTGIFFDTQTMA